MSSYDAPAGSPEGSSPATAPRSEGPEPQEDSPARVGTIVWGLIVVALAALIIISQLGIVALNGTYVADRPDDRRRGGPRDRRAALGPRDVTKKHRQGSLEPWKSSSAPSGASA